MEKCSPKNNGSKLFHVSWKSKTKHEIIFILFGPQILLLPNCMKKSVQEKQKGEGEEFLAVRQARYPFGALEKSALE